MKWTEQSSQNNCGPACLSTVFNYFNYKIPISEISELAKIDANGSSLYGLKQAAEKCLFDTMVLNGTYDELLDSVKLAEISLPCIVHIVKFNQLQHYIVIKKITSTKVYFFDPADGHGIMTKNEFENQWSGYVLTLRPGKEFCKKNTLYKNYKPYLDTFLENKKIFIYILVLSFILIFLNFIIIYFNKELINTILIGKTSMSKKIVLGLISLGIIQFSFGFIKTKIVINYDVKLSDIFMTLFIKKSNNVSMSYYENYTSGDTITRFNDIFLLSHAVSQTFLSSLIDFFTLLISSIILYNTSPILFTYLIVIVLIMLLYTLITKNTNKKLQAKSKNKHAELFTYLKESITGIESIKLLTIEKDNINKTQNKGLDYLKSLSKLQTFAEYRSHIISFTEITGLLIISLIAIIEIENNSLKLDEYILFQMLVSYFIIPLKNLVSIIPELQNYRLIVDRINNLVNHKTERKLSSENNDIKFNHITFTNVSYSYGYKSNVIDKMSYTFDCEKNYSIIGKSGSGKTTMAKLLVAIEDDYKGTITIDNNPINLLSLDLIRQNIIYISQKNFLFNDTIYNNLTIGIESIDLKKLENIVIGCKIFDDSDLNLDYLISENGENISGGQGQRISIARALLRKPKILILDEAFSQVDENTAREIILFIQEKFPMIMLIQIVHNSSFLKYFDKTVLFDKGKLHDTN